MFSLRKKLVANSKLKTVSCKKIGDEKKRSSGIFAVSCLKIG